MLPYAAAIALSAFLLFQVQPLAGKVLLPWYGGSAAVWSACLLFFQAALFLGYLYAHLVGDRAAPRRQAIVHLALLAVSLAFLPVAAGEGWEPLPGARPVPRILGFLAATVGLPYLLLAANSPLLQRWFTLRRPNAPWRLYALSNLGSLLGLLSYPLLVEPVLGLGDQRLLWSALYVGFAATTGGCAVGLARAAPELPAATAAQTREEGSASVRCRRGAAWATLVGSLALAGSLLMAATTHYLCQHVAVVPLLWILPLAVYLASFIVVFAGDSWYRRGPALAALAVTTVGAVLVLYHGFGFGLVTRATILTAQLAAGCYALHGEMVLLRPHASRLTGYYLLLAGGGALGTAFVTFAAPVLFANYWEYHVALAAAWGLSLLAAARARAERPGRPVDRRAVLAAAASLLALVLALRWHTLVAAAGAVRAERNFYGALQVLERDAGDPERERLELTNGGVLHGSQLTAPALRRRPTAYYGPGGALAPFLSAARERRRAAGGDGSLRIGCVGLGVGVLATYARPGDQLRCYEINPAVVAVAREPFTFLADSPARIDIALGDARLSLSREIAAGAPGRFDVLVVDAFTGDAVPAHLITREALRLYREHLAPGGRLLLHVSGRFLDLRPLVLGLAEDAGLPVLVADSPRVAFPELPSTWAAMAEAGTAWSEAELATTRASRPLPARRVLWTDEYSNLLGLIDPGAPGGR